MGRVKGAPQWVTAPVAQRSQKERIVEKAIDNSQHWAGTHFETLRRAYASAPHFAPYASHLQDVYAQRWERLVDLNEALLELLREGFGIRTPLVNSSELDVGGAKSELVLNLCRAVGAHTLLVGLGGSRDYLDPAPFAQRGIGPPFQESNHPPYP